MSPKSRGRPPGRGRARKRPSSPTSPVRELTPLDHVLREAPALHDADLLAAQVVASTWLGAAWRARSMGDRDAEGALVRDVVAATHGRRAGAAYLALHALVTVADEDWRGLVAGAVATAPPDATPPWAVDPATHAPQPPYAARRWSDPWGSRVVHLLRFADPVDHSLRVEETTVGGRFADVIEVGAQEGEPDDVVGELTAVEVDPAEALADVADLLWRTDLYWPPQDDPAYTSVRALARWRTRGHRREVDWQPLPDDERRRLVADFAQQQDIEDDPGVVEVLADTFVDFGEGYLHGGVLAWSPGEVERFMLDWVHRKVVLEPECRRALPAVLRAWVAFALHRRGLPPEHVAPVVDMVTELAEEYVAASVDGTSGGPAHEIAARLVAEGVDLRDAEAVRQVVGAYNAEQNARRLLDG